MYDIVNFLYHILNIKILFYFSFKLLKTYIKDADKTPLLSKTGKLTGISRALYELFVQGVRGNLRKEAVVLRSVN